ncbi:MAG: PAS domain S-box protein [Spirochaetaceae bacterium]|nr:PAS domain S-box protein [Spirochaetaceae bacterium]MCF7949019.1 PAS domain S-box protein [Spirochaetia bacterium]MCF7952220.1 PAS domain S-box protein [Spirochaetaceae bacterium]
METEVNREIQLLQGISNAYFKYDENEVYPRLLGLLLEELQGDFGLFGYIEEKQQMVCHTTTQETGATQSNDVMWFQERQWKSLWGHLAQTDVIEVKDSPATELEEKEYSPSSYLNAPLFFQGTFLGFIQIQSGRRAFTQQDIHIMERILHYISPIQYSWFENKLQKKKLGEYIKKLKKSEAKYRSLFTLSPDMIFLNTAEGKVVDINQAGAQLLGYDSPQEIIGTYAQNYYYDAEARNKLRREMDKKGYVKNLEIILQSRTGEKVFCLENAHRVMNLQKNGYVYQGIIHDITSRIEQEQTRLKQNLELSEANKQLREARDKLVQKEKMASIGQLSAGIAHEINNPLGFVKSNYSSLKRYLESIKKFISIYKNAEQVDPQKVQELQTLYEQEDLDYIMEDVDAVFTETEEGIQRIMSIVRNLKSFSRAGTEEVVESYNLNAGIESSLVIGRNEYKYVAEVEKKLSKLPPVACNANEINQVILNLIVNAANAIEEAGPKQGKIRIATWTDEANVYCSVSDNGPGIPEEIKSKIFDPFFTTKKIGKGTGLGLSISYDIIVNRHSGNLEVSSEKGRGSTFTFCLPIKTEKGETKDG